MAIVNDIRKDNTALDVIAGSKHQFYLGGSRRMSYIAEGLQCDTHFSLTESTDYDFYATYTPELVSYLEGKQFDETPTSYNARQRNGNTALNESIDNALRLYQRFDPRKASSSDYDLDDEAIIIMERDNVQVVLRKDALFYNKVFENIDPEFYYYHLWKSSPHPVRKDKIQPIFNMLFKIAHAQ
jgi:hypothetical protein